MSLNNQEYISFMQYMQQFLKMIIIKDVVSKEIDILWYA